MRRRSKARPSTASAHAAGSTAVKRRKTRGLFGLACLCVLGLVAFAGSSAPSVGAAESLPGQGFLPDNRAWEMVSPPNKNGSDIAADSQRTRAAVDGSAVGFISLGQFGDVIGTGIATDYIAERSTDPNPGTNGWATHAITPPEVGTSFEALLAGLEPFYVGEFSPDLDRGIYLTHTPQTADPNVEDVYNLYRRTDLRTPGEGAYELLTNSDAPLPPLPSEAGPALAFRPVLAGATSDLDRVIFESNQPLTGDTPANGLVHLYESEGAQVRLLGRIPTAPAIECDDAEGPACVPADVSIAGSGAGANHALSLTPHTISDGSDGHTRIFLTRPTNDGTNPASNGYEGDLYMRTDGIETVQINVSEREVPLGFTKSKFRDASADGTRAFFSTEGAALTDESAVVGFANKLYMYDADTANDEAQRLVVKATAGQYKLTFGAQSSADIAFDAPAATVQAELNALSSIGGAGGSVTVSGGPGNEAGTAPYLIAFGGSLAGLDQPLLTVSPGTTPLSGGAGSATASPWVKGGGHLTFVSPDNEPVGVKGSVQALVGIGGQGHYAYFVSIGQLIKGGPIPPTLNGKRALYLWHDGQLTFIAQAPLGTGSVIGEASDELASSGPTIELTPRQARVTPDGRHLLFSSLRGNGLGWPEPIYDHADHRQLYVYSADTGTIQCASCNPSGAPATVDATTVVRKLRGAAHTSTHETKAISDDGRYAFFTTAERLITADRNGVEDAYVFDTTTGEHHLLSSGEDALPSYFLDATPDGSDAFFVTREALSGWDVDTGYDLYDARVGGGFPEPPPAPPSCVGDACQPAPPVLNDPSPGSATVSGPGDRVTDRNNRKARCPQGKRRVKARGGKSRCVKRDSKRAANANRRAGR